MPKIGTPIVEEGHDEIGRFRAELLSDTGGLTQFGAFIETLWPGGSASKDHWHANEDEMVHVLEGVATLVEGGVASELHAGDTACFKAGVAVGHHLENRSDAPVRYLVIGTRSGDDVVTYSATGETVTIRDGEKVYRDADGVETARKPYHGA
ncbi:cupin domain-containing protein [Jannaschia sp. CCS1]|uniref:cupin domain-containing protein n=1 Tax=Jannaschia sp. (strain CCS1) TaxID=290400 RepID=UPI000053C0DB|nr:cupin domain-containing protein [Jannaschia sp. CCS1]ABD55853.1 Cupin 2 protein [Jannaschia sp. CCS1]